MLTIGEPLRQCLPSSWVPTQVVSGEMIRTLKRAICGTDRDRDLPAPYGERSRSRGRRGIEGDDAKGRHDRPRTLGAKCPAHRQVPATVPDEAQDAGDNGSIDSADLDAQQSFVVSDLATGARIAVSEGEDDPDHLFLLTDTTSYRLHPFSDLRPQTGASSSTDKET